MELYRTYFNEERLQQLADSEPNWGVNIRTVGHYVHTPHKKYPDAQHPNGYLFNWEQGRRLKEFQMVYISNGRGEFETENAPPSVLEQGTLLLLYPDVWHRYRPLEKTGWEEFWVGFDGHYTDYLMRQECFSPQNPLIDIGFDTEFLTIFIRLIETMKNGGVAHTQIASCLVIQLLALVYASALMTDKISSRRDAIIRNLRYKIHQNWSDELDMTQLAKTENVSYSWFRKAFKEVIGVSPGQYHLNIKLEKAAEMLKTTDFSVSEIADKTGFETEFYFSRFFKKKMGNAPTDYRKGNVS